MEKIQIIKSIRDIAKGNFDTASVVQRENERSISGHVELVWNTEASLTASFLRLRGKLLEVEPETKGFLPHYRDEDNISFSLNLAELIAGHRTLYCTANSILFNYTAELENAKKKISELEKDASLNILVANSIEKYINSEEFKLDEEQLKLCPKEFVKRYLDASRAFKYGLHNAVCVLCGTILEGITIKEGKGKTSSERLDSLAIHKGTTKKIVEAQKLYRDLTAHPATEFGKDEARISLSAVGVLCKELYGK